MSFIVSHLSFIPEHAPPLDITMSADTPIVISTEAKRSGEISLHHGTVSIEAGDLSAQSIIKASSICRPYRHAATLEMTKEPCLAPSKKRPQRGASAFDFIH